jgi:hypothetical protein
VLVPDTPASTARMNFLLRNLLVRVWLKRFAAAVAILMIALQWSNTRIAILKMNQHSATPVVPTTYYIYHSMATGMREGRIGQVDLLALREHANKNDPWAPFERMPRDGPHQWVSYYTLDIGYSFIVELARLLFPTLPDNHLRALALQLLADAALVFFVFYLFSEWHVVLGFLAAYLYASNGVFYDLVSFAFYYYWDIPLTFVVLGSLLLAYRRPTEATLWLTVGALALGAGVWIRGSWWPIGLFICLVTASVHDLRRKLMIPLVAFAIVAAPQVIRSSLVRGHLTFTTRSVWHVALVGLGYYPNPYGLEAQDGTIFELTRRKYGITFRSEDYILHDEAAKKEFFEIWGKDKRFVLGSFFGRLRESMTGSTKTSVLSFLFVSNVEYRLLCLLGLGYLIVRGGDRRVLGIAAAGSYLIYVVLTCVFYFVGLAYDNVSQVTLFVMFMGVFDGVLYLVERVYSRLPAFGVAGSAVGAVRNDEVPSGA